MGDDIDFGGGDRVKEEFTGFLSTSFYEHMSQIPTCFIGMEETPESATD